MRFAVFILVVAQAQFLWGQTNRIDLRSATLVVPKDLTAREQKAAGMLVDEIAIRTQIRLPRTDVWPASNDVPVIVLGPVLSLKQIAFNHHVQVPSGNDSPEGFRIWTEHSRPATSIWVAGNDERGVLFGAGRLLRALDMSRQQLALPADLQLDSAPQVALRGHQLGYRPKCNSYDGWDVRMWEQYIRDLAVFGCNAIELIPPRSDDAPDSPHFPLPQMQMMVEMSKLADEYGLDVWVWYPAMDNDYSNPATVQSAIKEWGNVFSKLPRIDAVFVPGGDPGHTRPSVLFDLLEKQAGNLRQFHPHAQMWVSPQSFNGERLDEFFQVLRKEPSWLSGIVYGPQIRLPLHEIRKLTPRRYPIRFYPDITHTQHCEFPVPDWDLAFSVTEGREPICPRPTQMANIFRRARTDTIGFITYSEGCNDDVNKAVFSALGWDPNADVADILRDYAHYFIGPQHADDFAQGLLALERNWVGPVLTNAGIDTALKQFQDMEKNASPQLKLNWRFQQALYRAYYDAYVRGRLIHETELERRALADLGQAKRIGTLAAMRDAERELNRAITEPVSTDVRARVFELAEALFQSIRMQLSVERYSAESVGRGANLDRIDAPVNNRLYLMKQFEQIRNLTSESDRLDRIHQIVSWTDPGPGGFYDDLGNLSRQPHLVRGAGWEIDPDFYHTACVRVEDVFDGSAPLPISWWSTAGTLYDEPLRMHYDELDRTAHYKLRVVYAPAEDGSAVRLVANDRYEVHPPIHTEGVRLEFTVPQEATASGHLDLTWFPQANRGHAGRNLQIAEVWLMKN
ncbi:MAG TPA: hypothetical protein VN541_13940 [Tepidisphaeraceae bacterium]|nr:hypothetical protein [Tepidisphaeraceae bacterium]